MKDIVVDTSAMRLFEGAKDPDFKNFFRWLVSEGVLTVSNYLLKEYSGIGSNGVAALIDILRSTNPPRYNKIERKRIDTFNDRGFRYSCNRKDKCHVKLVMLSFRRLALAQDSNLVNDVNRFPRYKARAAKRPHLLPYG